MNLVVSSAPHIRSPRTTKHIMLDVLIALLPAAVAGVVYFGWVAFVTILLAMFTAALTEFCWYIVEHKIWRSGKETFTAFFRQFDYTSLVTGLLLALVCPASLEALYMPVLGAVFAVAVVKMLFGGTGKNIVNPAIAGRIFLFISFTAMVTYPDANFGPLLSYADGALTTGATQLGNFLNGTAMISDLDLFLGTGVAGCIGETCKLALLVGYLYLCVRGVIKWYLPLLYIAATGLFAMALEGGFGINLFAEAIFSGGLFLGAIFMATDYVTTPKTTLGNIIYFIALGLFTAGLRKAVGIEVVSFAIFLMNFVVFLLDLVIRPRPFGSVKTRRAKQ